MIMFKDDLFSSSNYYILKNGLSGIIRKNGRIFKFLF